jgi:hypothetical protein
LTVDFVVFDQQHAVGVGIGQVASQFSPGFGWPLMGQFGRCSDAPTCAIGGNSLHPIGTTQKWSHDRNWGF